MLHLNYDTGLSQAWGLGGTKAPQFLAKQLTLSQPGGQIMPNTVLRAPPDFQTLRQPCDSGAAALLSSLSSCLCRSSRAKLKRPKIIISDVELNKCMFYKRSTVSNTNAKRVVVDIAPLSPETQPRPAGRGPKLVGKRNRISDQICGSKQSIIGRKFCQKLV